MLMNMAGQHPGPGQRRDATRHRAMKDLETLNPRPRPRDERDVHFPRHQHQFISTHSATAVGVLAVNGSANPSAIVVRRFWRRFARRQQALSR